MTTNKPNDVRVVSVELLEKISQTCMFTLSSSDYEQLRALLAQPADQQGEQIQLSEDVREYLQEGIENATGCEESDVDYDFANELAVLLGPLYRHAQLATAKVDQRAEFDRWTVSEGRVLGYTGWNRDFAVWLARAKLNGASEVVLPERMIVPDADCPERVNAQGWNACLDEVAKLNTPQ